MSPADKTLSYNQLYKYSLFFRKVLYRTVLERLRRLRARLAYREAAGCHEASRQAHCEAFLLCIFLHKSALTARVDSETVNDYFKF